MTQKSEVGKLVEKKMQAAMSAGRVKGFKPVRVPVSLRIDPGVTVSLDVLAEALGESRTGLATELLNAAIKEAAQQLNMPDVFSKEWLDQYGDKFRELMGKEAEGFTDEELEVLARSEG